MSEPAAPDWVVITTGAGIVFPSAVLIHLAGLRGHLGAVPLVAVAACCAVRATPQAAAVLGVIAWAFATGFVVNELGRLTVGRDDLCLLAGGIVTTTAVAVIATIPRVEHRESEIARHSKELHDGRRHLHPADNRRIRPRRLHR